MQGERPSRRERKSSACLARAGSRWEWITAGQALHGDDAPARPSFAIVASPAVDGTHKDPAPAGSQQDSSSAVPLRRHKTLKRLGANRARSVRAGDASPESCHPVRQAPPIASMLRAHTTPRLDLVPPLKNAHLGSWSARATHHEATSHLDTRCE